MLEVVLVPSILHLDLKLIALVVTPGLYLLDGEIVALLSVGHHQDLSCQKLSLLGEDWLGEQTSDLIPVSQGLGGGGAQPDGGVGSNEGNIKPEGDPVHCPGLQHVELQGNLNPVEVSLVRGLTMRKQISAGPSLS